MAYAFLGDKTTLDEFVEKTKEAGFKVRKETYIFIEDSRGEHAGCIGATDKKCVYTTNPTVSEILVKTAKLHGCRFNSN